MAFSLGSVRQPKESVQFVYSEPEVFTEGPDLMAGEAEMALYRSHVRHAEGPERAAGYHEVPDHLLAIFFVQYNWLFTLLPWR